MFYSVVASWGYNNDDVEVILATDSEYKAISRAIRELEQYYENWNVLIQTFDDYGIDITPKETHGFAAFHRWYTKENIQELKDRLVKLEKPN